MSPLEVTALVVGLWCAPAIPISVFVAYHAWRGTWGDTSTPYELYLERLYEVEQEQTVARTSERREHLPVEADRPGIQHGLAFREGQASSQRWPAA